MKNYQIFISYRRDGGEGLAGRLADRFSALGYTVFYDVESMRSGQFNVQLFDAISQCDDFIVVLPPKGLDRCVDKEDWVRQELAFALKNNKNVIPVMMRGFSFPDILPEDIEKIRVMEGVEASMTYFDSVIKRLESFFLSNKQNGLKKEVVDISFDMRRVKTFASCGNETTVFKVEKEISGNGINLEVNFEKTRLRDEIPEYAGAYYLKIPSIDVSGASKICFEACSQDDGIGVIWVEIKPKQKAWMHESFAFELSNEYKEYTIDLDDFEYPETIKCLEEITFVIKRTSFTNRELLKGSIGIRGLKIL